MESLLKFYYDHQWADLLLTSLVTIGGLASLVVTVCEMKESWKKYKKSIAIVTCGFVITFLIASLGCFVFLYFNPDVNCRNGLKFWKGDDNFAISTETAINAFRLAAERDHPLGCQYLGYILAFKLDNPEGLKMLNKAAKLGNAKAAAKLGEYYEKHCNHLEEQRQKEMAYIAYYQAAYLGDREAEKKVATLRSHIPLQVQGMALDECKKITINGKK